MVHVRSETEADIQAIHRINELAFEQPAEAKLVDSLREVASPFISLVAVDHDRVVGHICFTPVTVERSDGTIETIAGLAPMAVTPELQKRGVGSRLITAGLDACRRAGFTAVVVLGHPNYYPRFGFRPASQFGLRSEYDVPDPVFMALELTPGSLQNLSGLARYHAAFASV